MKTLRAILLGALLWLIIFVEISITMIGFKLSDLTVWIIHYIIIIPIAILLLWIYYRSGDKSHGILVGLVMLVVGIILDMLITVPLFIIPQGGSYLTYFTHVYMLVGFVEFLLISAIYSLIKK